MKIIGEKINGTRHQVRRAIAERDASFVRTLARRQVEAGADWLDVNVGTRSSEEPDDLVWVIKVVQEVVDVPLSLDSANPRALAAAIKEVRQTPLINSITGERRRLEGILPLVHDNGCSVIALALDDRGIPEGVGARVTVIRRLIDETRRAGVPDERVYVDPLILSLATDAESGVVALETMRTVRAEFPDVHLCAGLSNVSFGLPERSLINRVFLTLALAAGLDVAIVDPLDCELLKEMLAAELALGRDRFCRRYTTSYRTGKLGFARPANTGMPEA